MKLVIVGTALVVALVVAIAVTLVTGQFCETSRCASNPPNVDPESRHYSNYGWPFAWKTDAERWRIDNTFHPAYGFQENGISYWMFEVDTVANFLLVAAAELLLFATWLFWTRLNRRLDRHRAPAPRTS